MRDDFPSRDRHEVAGEGPRPLTVDSFLGKRAPYTKGKGNISLFQYEFNDGTDARQLQGSSKGGI
jgi:hypothetical protein